MKKKGQDNEISVHKIEPNSVVPNMLMFNNDWVFKKISQSTHVFNSFKLLNPTLIVMICDHFHIP